MGKYIVKNCPAFMNSAITCNDMLTTNVYCDEQKTCLTKQIIDVCREEAKKCDEQFDCSQCRVETTCGIAFAAELLKKFDIKEVDDGQKCGCNVPNCRNK